MWQSVQNGSTKLAQKDSAIWLSGSESENCLSQIGRISILDCGRHNAQFTVAPPQHFLYFFPEPHGHGSFRPTLGACAEVHSGGHRKQILSVLFTTCGAVRVGRRELKHRTM